jgi:hypothetical protein
MKHTVLAIGVLVYYFQGFLPCASAQAFGEYGRTLGGATQRQGSSVSKTPPGSNAKGTVKGGFQGVGDLGVQPLQNRLVVTADSAPLHPSQDDESQKIEELPNGAVLITIMQATGGNNGWYMVKTPKGIIGWVKSSDVLKQAVKK